MKRRKAREYALQILFMLDDSQFAETSPVQLSSTLELYLSQFASSAADSLDRKYLEKILFGTVKNISSLDLLIEKHSSNWKMSRMTRVDRNILRLAAYELLFLEQEVPPSVSLDEAVEMAKRYGSEDSAAFINGILDPLFKSEGK